MSFDIFLGEDRILTPEGVELYHRSWSSRNSSGNSEKFIILLHDVKSNSKIWIPLVRQLLITDIDSVVLSLDQRGHGSSEKSQSGYKTAQMVEDIYTLIDHEFIAGESITLVGQGWGATDALAYATTFPKGISGLVLIDGRVKSQSHSSSDLIQDGKLYQEIAQAILETDHLDLAAKIQCPVLLITSESITVPENSSENNGFSARQLQGAFTGSLKVQLEVMKGSGVNFLSKHPSELAELIAAFSSNRDI